MTNPKVPVMHDNMLFLVGDLRQKWDEADDIDLVVNELMDLNRFSNLLYRCGTLAIERLKPVHILICSIEVGHPRCLANRHFEYKIQPAARPPIEVQPVSPFTLRELEEEMLFWIPYEFGISSIDELEVMWDFRSFNSPNDSTAVI